MVRTVYVPVLPTTRAARRAYEYVDVSVRRRGSRQDRPHRDRTPRRPRPVAHARPHRRRLPPGHGRHRRATHPYRRTPRLAAAPPGAHRPPGVGEEARVRRLFCGARLQRQHRPRPATRPGLEPAALHHTGRLPHRPSTDQGSRPRLSGTRPGSLDSRAHGFRELGDPGHAEGERWLRDCAYGDGSKGSGNAETWLRAGHTQHMDFVGRLVTGAL